MRLLKYVIRYKKFVTKDEKGNELIRYYPMIPCRFEWRGIKSPEIDGLLDSGSDGIVIPTGLAKFLKLELTEAKPMQVVGCEVSRYVSTANLILGRGGRYVSFPNVEVSSPKEGDTPIIIGRKPVFEYYEINFIEAEKKVIMTPYREKHR